ncbi:unnamed protein product, partial [Brenthis ino]
MICYRLTANFFQNTCRNCASPLRRRNVDCVIVTLQRPCGRLCVKIFALRRRNATQRAVWTRSKASAVLDVRVYGGRTEDLSFLTQSGASVYKVSIVSGGVPVADSWGNRSSEVRSASSDSEGLSRQLALSDVFPSGWERGYALALETEVTVYDYRDGRFFSTFVLPIPEAWCGSYTAKGYVEVAADWLTPLTCGSDAEIVSKYSY